MTEEHEVRLVDDHPLVKAYAAVREQLKTAKAEAAASAAEARKNAEKATKYDELESANATELEKATKRAEELAAKVAEHEKADQERAAKAELDKVRGDVAKAKGLSASLLRGSSQEDFEQHADELIAAGIKVTPAPSTDGQGTTGDPVGSDQKLTPDEIVKAATGR